MTANQLKPYIFAIDDEPDALEIFEDALGKYFLIDGFTNPVDALSVLEKQKPDLVVTDIMMPNLNGVDLIKEAKKIMPNLPFIVMSGHSDRKQIIEIFKLGCFDFVSKPFRYDDLAHKINQVLGQNSSSRDDFSSRIAKDCLHLSRKGDTQEIHFLSEVLSHNELCSVIRKQLYLAWDPSVSEFELNFDQVDSLSSENLVAIHSYLKHLKEHHKPFSIKSGSEAIRILLNATFVASGEAI